MILSQRHQDTEFTWDPLSAEQCLAVYASNRDQIFWSEYLFKCLILKQNTWVGLFNSRNMSSCVLAGVAVCAVPWGSGKVTAKCRRRMTGWVIWSSFPLALLVSMFCAKPCAQTQQRTPIHRGWVLSTLHPWDQGYYFAFCSCWGCKREEWNN